MSIRVKLILTYGILILVSTVILVTSGIAIVAGIFQDVASTVVAPEDLNGIIPKAIDLLAELKQAEDYNPEKLVDPVFIENFSHKAAFYNGGVVVRYDNQHFNFSGLPDNESFYSQLQRVEPVQGYRGRAHGEDARLIREGDSRYFFMDYAFDVRGESVTYFFVLDVSKTKMGYGSGTTFFRVIGGLLLVVMIPLLVIITQDIIKPIRQLERGVEQIKAGNLEYKLTSRKRNELGRVIRYFDLMRQELKVAIEKQVKAEENRKELISSISHDLKTPITSIKGHVEGILDGVANTAQKQEKYLQVIYEKSKDLDALIDELFLFSKLDMNKVPYAMRDVPIDTFVGAVVDEMRVGWESSSRQMSLVVDPLLVGHKVTLDEQQMKRVLVNLIHNSMKYMQKGDKVSGARVSNQASESIMVTLRAAGDCVSICVADNGVGISQEDLPLVFDRFYRVDQSRNAQEGGTGLGLAIAKQIVEHHEGEIHADSQLGEGTTICITLKKSLLINEKDSESGGEGDVNVNGYK